MNFEKEFEKIDTIFNNLTNKIKEISIVETKAQNYKKIRGAVWIVYGVLFFVIPLLDALSLESGNSDDTITIIFGIFIFIVPIVIVIYLKSIKPNFDMIKNKSIIQQQFNNLKTIKQNYLSTDKFMKTLKSSIESNRPFFVPSVLFFNNKESLQYFSANLKSAIDKNLLNVNTTNINDAKLQWIIQRLDNYLNIEVIESDYVYKELHSYSLIKLDNFMTEQGLYEYGILEVERSSNNKITPNTYFYSINHSKDFCLIKEPYVIVNNNYILFTQTKLKQSIESKALFEFGQIKDFQLFGAEMMQSTIQTVSDVRESSSTIKSPRLVRTMLSEFILGSSYTMLKGMSSMMQHLSNQLSTQLKPKDIVTTHRIIDTRKIIILLNDTSDIEIKGISIFYDFNRKMGRSKNIDKPTEKTKLINQQPTQPTIDYEDKLIKIKKLYDEGILTEDEYLSKKAKYLSEF